MVGQRRPEVGRVEPRPVHGISRRFWLVIVAEHNLPARRPHTFRREDSVRRKPQRFPVHSLDDDTSLAVRLEIIYDLVAEFHVNPSLPGMIEDNLVDFSTMAIEPFAIRILLVPVLRKEAFPQVAHKLDVIRLVADRIQLLLNAFPFLEDASAVGAEGDDIAEDLQLGECIEEHHIMAFAVAFNRSGKAGEPRADNNHPDPRRCFLRGDRHYWKTADTGNSASDAGVSLVRKPKT